MEITLTDQNFDQEVIKSATPVLVDFWAPWCGPCRMMAPIIEELAEEIDGSKLKIGKLNVDENGVTAQQFNIMSIPTFLVFQGGKVVDQFVGGMTKAAFKDKLAKYIA
ncbi:MAG: thioredoxin [Patescibacteria group bacterium]|nr:thioredoxin [Patescibacteria group bacterium]